MRNYMRNIKKCAPKVHYSLTDITKKYLCNPNHNIYSSIGGEELVVRGRQKCEIYGK